MLHIKYKKGKRGMTLLEFVIDLVIGILCALIILYLITLVYGIFFSGKEKEEAIQTLSAIEERTSKLSLGETDKEVPLKVPAGDYLLSFENGVNSGKKDILPQTFCADANCLCVCKSKKIFGFIKVSVDCQKLECKIFNNPNPFKENGNDLDIKIPQEKLIQITNSGTFFNVEIK